MAAHKSVLSLVIIHLLYVSMIVWRRRFSARVGKE